MLKLPDGRQSEFRLYFVDTPESAFKSYRGGETNRQRINEQAAEMGGISAEQAVEIGKQGKQFTLGLLASRPFDIYTRWDSPFHDDRFHAFVSVQQAGKSRWLEELLVERGLVRIHTKPADLPDGTSAAAQKSHLKELERTAKRSQAGVWGL
jgi:endonuclease YncB( thermonuclease family)